MLSTRRGAKSGTYVLEMDEAVLDQLEAAGRHRRATAPAATRAGMQSALTPREIQARLRAGYSMEDVAVEAGVGVDWIERFAFPVLAELASAISRALRTVPYTVAAGPSDCSLEASVLHNLAGRGIVLEEGEFQSAWSARHLADAEWCVAFTFRNRGRDVVAEWALNGQTGALTARNRFGEDLGYVGPRPPVTPSDRARVAALDSTSPAAPPAGAAATGSPEGRPSSTSAPDGPPPDPTVRPVPAESDRGSDDQVLDRQVGGVGAIDQKEAEPKAPRRRRRSEPPMGPGAAGTEGAPAAGSPATPATPAAGRPTPPAAGSPATPTPPAAGSPATPATPATAGPGRAPTSDSAQPRLPMADMPRPVSPTETGQRD